MGIEINAMMECMSAAIHKLTHFSLARVARQSTVCCWYSTRTTLVPEPKENAQDQLQIHSDGSKVLELTK